MEAVDLAHRIGKVVEPKTESHFQVARNPHVVGGVKTKLVEGDRHLPLGREVLDDNISRASEASGGKVVQ